MARPVIALLTDFGTRDHYVGAMKAVMLGICPDVTLVDITHDVPPHDVLAGALELAACYREFPSGTVFVVVVDPGVGSSRRGMVVDLGEYRVVAPDNGVLTGVFARTPPKRLVDLTERKYQRPILSRTFEGRDRFAPAAAWLARGVPVIAFGRTITDHQVLSLPVAVASSDSVHGEIVRVDRFGNLISNIDRELFERATRDRRVDVTIGAQHVPRVVGTYAEAPAGELCALFGSTNHLEVALNGGSAAARLASGRGAPLIVRTTPRGTPA